MQKVNGKYPVRIENCIDCGNEFIIVLEEIIQKTESGMRLPKRCVACRKKRRYERDPYAGWLSTLGKYPATKGHRHSVHGGR